MNFDDFDDVDWSRATATGWKLGLGVWFGGCLLSLAFVVRVAFVVLHFPSKVW